jgi:hypothetical protein
MIVAVVKLTFKFSNIFTKFSDYISISHDNPRSLDEKNIQIGNYIASFINEYSKSFSRALPK